MCTLKDIADRLGVTVSTVSRALSGSGRISREMRAKVQRTAALMGYQPNESARVLKTGRASTIGMIAPDITDIFYSRLLKSISAEACSRGYGVLYCDGASSLELEKSCYELLLSKNVAGIIIATTGGNHIYDGASENERLIFVDNLPYPDADVCCVSIDHVRAGYDLAAHMLKISRDIALITGDLHETSASERLKGHMQCLKEHGIESCRFYEGNYRFDGGYAAAGKMLAEGVPSAVIAHNHLLANGASAAFMEAGFRIPEDISIACFDIYDKSNLLSPRIARLLSPVDELGVTAVRLIIDRISEKSAAKGRIFLPHRLI